jgi:hypothetical protein
MAPSLLPRLRRSHENGAAPPAPPKRRRVAPPASELRRERRALMAVREERLRDLGGLALEMYRRDRFRSDLLLERCSDLIALEARIHELDALLSLSSPLRRATPIGRCVCGAPLLHGMNFCATCGRPAAAARPTPPA